jgi:hypothetical protein
VLTRFTQNREVDMGKGETKRLVRQVGQRDVTEGVLA